MNEEELGKLLEKPDTTELPHKQKQRLDDVNEIVGQIDAFVALELTDEYHIDDIMRALKVYVEDYYNPTI